MNKCGYLNQDPSTYRQKKHVWKLFFSRFQTFLNMIILSSIDIKMVAPRHCCMVGDDSEERVECGGGGYQSSCITSQLLLFTDNLCKWIIYLLTPSLLDGQQQFTLFSCQTTTTSPTHFTLPCFINGR